MNEPSQYLLLVRYHLKMARSRCYNMLREAKLMALTLGLFLAAYAALGYYLFGRGLSLVESFPGVGGFLGDRVIYLVFFFFLLMLIVSAGVTNYIGLIKGTEVPWLLTLPLSHGVVFLWKATEALVFASWSVVFLSAPMLVAFAETRQAPWVFYPVTLVCLLAFVVVAGTAGSALFLALLRWGNRPVSIGLAVLGVTALVAYGWVVYRETMPPVQHRALGAVAVDEVLRHTEASVHPLSPSSWLSRTVILWTRELRHEAAFYPFVLVSWALMGVLVLREVGARWFYPAWNLQQQREAFAAGTRRRRSQGRQIRWNWHLGWIPGLRRPIRAVIRKDLVTFVRDPSQWVQFAVVFGLLLAYVVNLRNLGRSPVSERWSDLISYVNLAVCALAVSTLTTRFVFPQFSLEGSRLWILGMAPLGLEKVVLQKWVQASVIIGILSTGLQLLSSSMLHLSRDVAMLHAASVWVQTLGLCGIAAGLGTLFPNLEETNSAKIVSGFGGTLCLICSFLYILAFVLTLKVCPSRGWGVAGAAGWTLLLGGGPMILAWRRARRFEFTTLLG